MTRKIIVDPCRVMIWLYFSGERNVLSGAPSWMRISSASTPPTTKNASTVHR
jgi:hypothetical protein